MRDNYYKRFPELESLVQTPIEYMKTVKVSSKKFFATECVFSVNKSEFKYPVNKSINADSFVYMRRKINNGFPKNLYCALFLGIG